ncbi:MAG TPA: transposase [Thermoanaerobaculia bacterium]|jgi:REP element-mobilizing transposase RayT|nr:transposase [Thermoanaerobaculia bacterium]
MARPLRLEYPGALWHVTNRGVDRRSIYADDVDRRLFLHFLAKTINECRWQLLAYVLMSNHYHLFFRTPETNLSRGMKDIDGDYASSFNMRHQRAGHLFQGRFKSHLVDSETYLVEVARYIVLNPVRAHVVATPAEWRWSSYRATAGLAAIPRWLDPGPILDVFNADDWNAAMHGYREFVAAAIGRDTSPWENLVAQTFLGGTQFLQQVERTIRERKCSSEHPRDQRMFRAATIESVKAAVESMRLSCYWPPPSGSDARALFCAARCAQY